jgi:ChrB-like protein
LDGDGRLTGWLPQTRKINMILSFHLVNGRDMKLSVEEKPGREIAGSATRAPRLLLVHQLPPKPAYLLVKIWHRLQGPGVVSVKNSVYGLPTSEQEREDFHCVLNEIERSGGEGMIYEANLVDGLSDRHVRGLFDAARDADHAQLTKELRGLAGLMKGCARRKAASEIKPQLVRLRRRALRSARSISSAPPAD